MPFENNQSQVKNFADTVTTFLCNTSNGNSRHVVKKTSPGPIKTLVRSDMGVHGTNANFFFAPTGDTFLKSNLLLGRRVHFVNKEIDSGQSLAQLFRPKKTNFFESRSFFDCAQQLFSPSFAEKVQPLQARATFSTGRRASGGTA
jgi:hypothetical protein